MFSVVVKIPDDDDEMMMNTINFSRDLQNLRCEHW